MIKKGSLPNGELWNVYSNNPDQEPKILGIDPAKPGSDYTVMTSLLGLSHFQVDAPINMAFTDDHGEQVGEFLWDKDKRNWTFIGNADESAKIFSKFMFAHFQSLIDGNRDGL